MMSQARRKALIVAAVLLFISIVVRLFDLTILGLGGFHMQPGIGFLGIGLSAVLAKLFLGLLIAGTYMRDRLKVNVVVKFTMFFYVLIFISGIFAQFKDSEIILSPGEDCYLFLISFVLTSYVMFTERVGVNGKP